MAVSGAAASRAGEVGAAGVRSPPGSERTPRLLVLLLAVTSGATVANLYYIQPLLNVVARAFAVSDATAGLLVTCAQVGYVAGLALLVPLGDLLERRRLMAGVLVCASAALAVCAAAPSFGVLALALVAVGSLSVVAQIAVPLASTLAAEHERGRVVGNVMSGLLVGILASRTLSGLVAQLGGWRLVFALAAIAMLVLAVAVRRLLPAIERHSTVPYRAALRSVLELIAQERLLRERMLLGALGFANFSALWTSIAFLLGHDYGYDEAVIGLFGLAGAAGALVAPLAGRLADRGHGHRALGAFLVAVVASWGLLALGGSSLVALIAGIVLLDLGVQGAHISNQTAIYRLRPQARSRLTTAYMVSVFLGGIAGSLLSASVYGTGGWSAVCVLGAGVAGCAVIVWGVTRRAARLAPELG
jgi:predicted MFS family arabinose efflux permease